MEGTKPVDWKEVPLFSYRMVLGRLAHDNTLTDRQCSNPACRHICQSAKNAVCPKCGAVLDYLRTSQGIPYCVSEGTYYPLLYPAFKAKWTSVIEKSKKLAIPEYRFKLYKRMDATGVLHAPENHHNMKKGQVVEIIQRNQAAFFHAFPRPKRQDGKGGVEELMKLDDRYGDSVRLIVGEEYNKLIHHAAPEEVTPAMASLPPTPNGVPAGAPDIEAMRKRIAELEKVVASATTPPPVLPPAQTAGAGVSAEDDEYGY